MKGLDFSLELQRFIIPFERKIKNLNIIQIVSLLIVELYFGIGIFDCNVEVES